VKLLITEKMVLEAARSGKSALDVPKDSLITPLAHDAARQHHIAFVTPAPQASPPKAELPNVVCIGSDHTGVAAKDELKTLIASLGFSVTDVGTNSADAVDYPDIAFKVGERVRSGNAKFGVMIDGIGTASAIVLNKMPSVRAASSYNEFTAKTARTHNDTNVLTLGSRSLGIEVMKSVTKVFLTTAFEGERHAARLAKVQAIEQKFMT
jgi:ribose 5-phosphate isomerase B